MAPLRRCRHPRHISTKVTFMTWNVMVLSSNGCQLHFVRVIRVFTTQRTTLLWSMRFKFNRNN